MKIVSVNFGYVSLLTKLVPYGTVSCILICEPNYVVAAEDSRNLHIWMMSTGWRYILLYYKFITYINIKYFPCLPNFTACMVQQFSSIGLLFLLNVEIAGHVILLELGNVIIRYAFRFPCVSIYYYIIKTTKIGGITLVLR